LDAEIGLEEVPDSGARATLQDGSRPSLWLGETGPDGEPQPHSVVLRLPGGGRLPPGEPVAVRLAPLAFETWPEVRAGTRFDVLDGPHLVGRGRLTASPASSVGEDGLRRALADAFEEWVTERFGDRVARRPRPHSRPAPDFVVRFSDDAGRQHALLGEVVAHRPRRRDVERLAHMMERHGAPLGIVVALDEPSASTLDAIYAQGTTAMSAGVRVPRIRVVTARDLARDAVELLPRKRRPEALELLAA